MPSLLERLRAALAPRYEVEGEVASGGMATVFRAHDTSLDRLVAVKVLRPEMATATGEARFLREARTLASFTHPNMVSIHDADQRDGLYYYVMDLIEDETLAERLERGPLDGRDAFRLGRDMLDALKHIHAAGVVHRDIKPSNIFLQDGRALLADFGIASVEAPTEDTLTAEGRGPATPAYMSPEQAAGQAASPTSDLYSLGMVLYEALSGRRWTLFTAPDSGDWTQVPAAARPVLRTALALDSGERWKDAAEFRGALRTRRPWVRVPRWAAILAVIGIAALAWWGLGRSGPRPPGQPEVLRDVAVFPCEPAEASDSLLGANIGRYVAANLEVTPGITRVPNQTVASWYEARVGNIDPNAWTEALGARHAARCNMNRRPDGLAIDLRLLGETGEQVFYETVLVDGATEEELLRTAASSVSTLLVFELTDLSLTDEEADRFADVPFAALSHFLSGQNAFRKGAWKSAEEQYDAALEADSSFTLARLRRAEVRRWRADRPIDEDLSEVLEMDLSSLGPLDSLLLVASATPHGPDQLDAFESILALPEYHLDAYATLLYADELYHRGGLWGVPIDSAVAMLERAVRRDSFLVPAVEHLAQALIRTGREEEAKAVLPHLGRIHAPRGESDLYYPDVWKLGFLEKFHPDLASESRESMDSVSLETLGLYARWVRYIDSPSTQAELGELLVSAADQLGSPPFAAQGFIDWGIGLIGQGFVDEGVAKFDSAASRLTTDETVVQAAEWATIPYALGIDGFTTANAERGQRVLEAMWSRPGVDDRVKARAATALALLADRRGDKNARDGWVYQLDSMRSRARAATLRPARLISAVALASRGRYREALDLTAEDMAYDSAGLADRPFLRSALYLKRRDWYQGLGMQDSANASWLWHQNTDLEGTAGVPPQLIQAGEVDGALGHAVRRSTATDSTGWE